LGHLETLDPLAHLDHLDPGDQVDLPDKEVNLAALVGLALLDLQAH
jgi:hypothetical protein